MTRAALLIAAVLGTWISAAASVAAEKAADRPNLIVILSDDAGYNDFTMHGGETATPRIDALAESGVRCTNGYVSGCVCSPSRAGLLTGRYQQRFGHEYNIPPAYSEVNGLPLTETLFPAMLKEAGYRTIALGKWHLGYAPKFHPLDRGFTDYYGFLQGQRSYFPLEKPTRLNQILRDRDPVRPEKFDYMTDHLADEAAKYIADSKDKPFFIYLAFNATHGPNHATEADLATTGGKKVPAMTIALDRAVGKVMDALQENDLTDNTIVFFLNDNGGTPAHDNRPLHGFKGSCWEGGTRVPFVVSWPAKLPKGKVYDEPVIALDIASTCLAAAGVEPSGQPLDGVDLTPYLSGKEAKDPHEALFWKMGSNWSVRSGDYKLVGGHKEQDGKLQLFNLSKDIAEAHDIAAEHPEVVKRLHDGYKTWVKTHQATLWAPKKGKKASDD
ncbi:sulfatase-like hydrolase/transferase [Blastopirellula sp. JC732]|uniref:Sulfatase-like hydrolase/transferase n=1 Tax=Blastopirellula sediminis TaxID=2894196 RepID=A0A9X1MJ85_9BACT|nr:sulfatase-like hydrolase/transferase [Blastopirellula sediminis]MCC9607997.1 sulfatase-like hydrolase/transferase [Blastopirellula sediminis]MCC9627210.1 sulfatase-like hydrolase/transferase [Blastopirellula sediminis]